MSTVFSSQDIVPPWPACGARKQEFLMIFGEKGNKKPSLPEAEKEGKIMLLNWIKPGY